MICVEVDQTRRSEDPTWCPLSTPLAFRKFQPLVASVPRFYLGDKILLGDVHCVVAVLSRPSKNVVTFGKMTTNEKLSQVQPDAIRTVWTVRPGWPRGSTYRSVCWQPCFVDMVVVHYTSNPVLAVFTFCTLRQLQPLVASVPRFYLGDKILLSDVHSVVAIFSRPSKNVVTFGKITTNQKLSQVQPDAIRTEWPARTGRSCGAKQCLACGQGVPIFKRMYNLGQRLFCDGQNYGGNQKKANSAPHSQPNHCSIK